MTNEEWIKSMNTEEWAHFLKSVGDCAEVCDRYECGYRCAYECPYRGSYGFFLEWLREDDGY